MDETHTLVPHSGFLSLFHFLFYCRQIETKDAFLEALFSTVVNFDFQTLYLRWTTIPSSLPVLMIWGDKDALAPYDNNTKILASIPHVCSYTTPSSLPAFMLGFVGEALYPQRDWPRFLH